MADVQVESRISVQDRPDAPGEHREPPRAETTQPPPKRRWQSALVLLLLLTISVAGVTVYRRWQSGHAFPEGLIQVNGRIEGDSVTIASKYAGRIALLHVREGDTVTKGQVVVELDAAEIRAQCDQAKANLQMARSQAQGANTNVTLTSATTNAQILQSEGLVSQAASGISSAHADLQRTNSAIINASAQYRTAEASVTAAQAALQAAHVNKTRAQSGLASARAQVTTAQANVRAAQAAVNAAQAAYERDADNARRMAQLLAGSAVSEQMAAQANLAALASKAQTESARQQVSAAEAVVAARESDVESAQQQVAAGEAAIGQAQAQVVAAKEQALAAKAGKRQAEAQARSAQQAVYQAQAKRQQALGDLDKARTAPQQVDISRTTHAQAQAHVTQAQAAVKELESVLHDLSPVSPVSGTVTTRIRDIGEIVSAGTPILDIIDLDNLYLKAYVPENQIGKLRRGLPARIYVDAFPKAYFEATVTYIASNAEFTPKEVQTPDERVKLVYAVRLTIKNNAERRLTPGMVADAIIQWKEGETWQRPRW